MACDRGQYFARPVAAPGIQTYGNTGQGNWCIKKYKSTQCNWQFVQRAHHAVCCGARHTHTPRAGVRDEHGRETGEDHGDHEVVAAVLGEVCRDVDG